MGLVHCNSVYWTALTNVCHIQACKAQKIFSPELQWAKTTLSKQLQVFQNCVLRAYLTMYKKPQGCPFSLPFY